MDEFIHIVSYSWSGEREEDLLSDSSSDGTELV